MTSSASISSSHRPSEFVPAGTELGTRLKDGGFTALLWSMAALAVAAIFGVVVILSLGAWPVLRQAGPTAFLAGLDWHPSHHEYSLIPMIAGTFAVSFGALAIAGPLGIICALLTRFYVSEAVAGVFRILLQLLAGIPSVVYGLWGLSVLVPLIADLGGAGSSILAGIIILAVMVLPTVAVIAETALRQQSSAFYQGGIALGLPRYRVLWRVVLPAAGSKLVAAGILGLARALGETMAVLMVTGNAIALPTNLLSSIRTLAANIALEMAYALDLHRAALFATGLMLMILVFVMLGFADRLENQGESDA
jgi:phosphate transport system permease protein